MRQSLALALVLAALLVPAAARAADVIIQAASPAAAQRAARATGGSVVRSIPQLDAYLVRLSGPAGPVLSRLRSAPGVHAAVPNDRQPLAEAAASTLAPGDELVPYQWYLERIEAAEAWDQTLGDPNVVIAILDTGIDLTHPEFAGRVIVGPDIADGDDDPTDTHGHGTAVAGVTAAAANGAGIVGVCPACTLMAVKVVKDGTGEVTKFDSAAGIVWAVDRGADVINLSFSSASSDPVQQDAAAYAWAHGAIVVAAAGNEAISTPQYPASYENVVAVAAATDHNRLWKDSAFGSWVDIGAPGVNLLTPALRQSYRRMTGTSFATPIVAGAAGLLLAGVSGLTNADAVEALRTGTLPLAGTEIRRVSLPRALRRALGGPIEPDPPLRLTLDPLLLNGEDPLAADRVRVKAGKRLDVIARVTRSDTGERVRTGTIVCRVRVGSLDLPPMQETFRLSIARCIWTIPAGTAGLTVRGSMTVRALGASARSAFSTRIRRP